MSVNERERTDPLVEIADLAEELCDRRQHTETVYEWSRSRNRVAKQIRTVQAGLLEQLHDAIHSDATTDEQGRRGIQASRPPLLLEALARWLDIVTGANEWMSHAREQHRGDVAANIRALVGAAARFDSAERHRLLRDLRRWRTWAAVMSGWAHAPLQPHVACPNPECAAMGSLRVFPERKSGFCVDCRHVWDDRDGSINVLANYIRNETAKPRVKVVISSTAQGNGGWAERKPPNAENRVDFPDWVRNEQTKGDT